VTLLPTQGAKDRPDLPEYALGWQCMVPECEEKREEGGGHHVWRRSAGTRSWWVELADGTIVPNRVGLCPQHHKDVTGEVGGHRARIEVLGFDKLGWKPILSSGQVGYATIMQFAHDPFAVLEVFYAARTMRAERESVGMQQTVDGEEVPHEQVVEEHHEGLEPGTTCPTCKRRVNHKKKKSSPESKVVSYRVPIADEETHTEIAEAAAEALEKDFTKKPHWRWALNTYAYGLILQGARMTEKGE
jgi:hypothetical protein